MLSESPQLMPLWAFALACAVALAGGFVKGAIGFALPLIIVSGLSMFLDPLLAVAGVIFSALLSNILQAGRHGLADMLDAARSHWRYLVIVSVMIVIVAQFVTRVPEQTLYLILGVPVIGLSAIQLAGLRLTIPPVRRNLAEWIIGGISGAIGGFTGTWGPPTVLYLMALGLPKQRQLLVQGVIYSVGSISLVAGHLQSGVLNGVTAPFSAALFIPAFIGMQVGFWAGDRLDAARFRTVTLVVLIVAGANLVRRGLVG